MNHPPIVFIDVETTGGRAGHSKVIDIGAIRVENGQIVKTMNQLLDPERSVPAFITRLTGITNEMTWNAPKFNVVADELEELLNGAIFAAHHVDFDYSFIKTEFRRIGVQFNHDRLCTVKLSRFLHPEYRRHELDSIIGRMELNVEHRHRGYDDANVLVQLFRVEHQIDSQKLMLGVKKLMINTRIAKHSHGKQLSLFRN